VFLQLVHHLPAAGAMSKRLPGMFSPLAKRTDTLMCGSDMQRRKVMMDKMKIPLKTQQCFIDNG
jgi:hypothetical protein